MKRYFNVTGLCTPDKHYMVDISKNLAQIRKLVDRGAYFTMNRARQYGKTTTLVALTRELADDYFVIRMDFQVLGNESFKDENTFSLAFAYCFTKSVRHTDKGLAEKNLAVQELIRIEHDKEDDFDLRRLFAILQNFCETAPKPVVLMVDEVDSAANNQVFLDFLAQLRYYYLERAAIDAAAFQSVILAGVYDIRNLKRKLRSDEDHKTNSPWNIAADFDVDMSFSRSGIAGMLQEYETDAHTGMDIDEMAELLYEYTSGYPFLVSRLCMLMDEKVGAAGEFDSRKAVWSKDGFLLALRMLLSEKNTLFESLTDKLESYPDLKQMLKELLFSGKEIVYNALESSIALALMFGFVKRQDNVVIPANRIFDTLLYNYFLSQKERQGEAFTLASQKDKSQFIVAGRLNMRRVLEKFAEHFHELYRDCEESFLENVGRRFFLLYLRPIINGTGNYYIEAQTRDLGRTDVIVDYAGEQFVIELKIWHGKEYNRRGEKQLLDYMDFYHTDTGYMLSFNVNHSKQVGVQETVIDGKKLIEAVV